MAATNDFDRMRLMLEDILAELANADDHLRVAGLRVFQWARTQEDADVVTELLAARQSVEQARLGIAGLHPNESRKTMRGAVVG
jgi:UDP-glucose 4-epimerase